MRMAKIYTIILAIILLFARQSLSCGANCASCSTPDGPCQGCFSGYHFGGGMSCFPDCSIANCSLCQLPNQCQAC